MNKLLAIAGLMTAMSLPSVTFAAETQCSVTFQQEVQVLNCSPIADPEAYYYAGPATDYPVNNDAITLAAFDYTPPAATVALELGISGN